MEPVFSYKEPGRRPATYLAAVVFALFFGAAVTYGAEWYVYLPVVLGGVMLLYMLVKNPVSGVALLDEFLVLSAWSNPQKIPLRDIARIEIISWSDSIDMKVHLKSGGAISAFAGDIPPREPFRAALAEVGIPLDIA